MVSRKRGVTSVVSVCQNGGILFKLFVLDCLRSSLIFFAYVARFYAS